MTRQNDIYFLLVMIDASHQKSSSIMFKSYLLHTAFNELAYLLAISWLGYSM